MALDLSGVVGIITSETVMFAALAFFAGMAGVISYHRLLSLFKKTGYQADDSVTEAIVIEYTRRLRDYDRVIAELRTKVDIMEMRAQVPNAGVTSQQQPSQPPQPHVARVIETSVVTQHQYHQQQQSPPHVEVGMHGGQNGTTDYILKMIGETPRTSREVQQAIGRTREHTSRLMKKLTESQLVARDMTGKPFKYTLTDLGRERLREKAEVASELRNP